MREDFPSELKPAEIEEAIALRLKQLENNPASAEICLDLGDLYAKQAKLPLAIKSYQQAIALNANLVDAHQKLALVLQQKGNIKLAANHLYKAYQLDPTLAVGKEHYELGQTFARQNRFPKAIACYKNAIDCQPDYFPAYEAWTELLKEEKHEGAIAVYRLGIKNNPQDARYYYNLATTFAERQEWSKASNNYQKAAELKPSPQIYYHHGLALIKLEKIMPAESCFQHAISLQQNYVPALYQVARLQKNRQQWQKAISTYKKIIALNSAHKWSLVDLGTIYRHLKKYNRAIANYRSGIEHTPKGLPLEKIAFKSYFQTLEEHPEVSARQYHRLAKLFRSRGYFTEAIIAFCKSIELDPQFRISYIDLQYTQITARQSVALIEFYRRILRKNPEITIAWGNLGDVLTQQNRIDEAIYCYRKGVYQKAIQLNPELAKLDWSPTKKLGPDFIVAGAAKCGTSSIYKYLSYHPQILLPHKKELNFYSQNYQLGIDWYLAHFPSISDRAEFLAGEATPNYLRFPEVTSRIQATFPQTKIIILLRNPVDRAISWHYHKYNDGLSDLDLATAVKRELKWLANATKEEILNAGYRNPDNILGSLYIYQIQSWVETLGREQLLILQSEDFYLNPQKNMKRVFQFLGLPNHTLDKYPQINAGSYAEIDPKIRKTLAEYFAPYNRQLEEYLGMEFNWQ